jgi:hypothetical protein
MKTCPFTRLAWLAILLLSGAAPPPKSSSQPAYPLAKENGPWLVVVKSFQGPQAIELANELARELREKHRITAYTFVKRPGEAGGVLSAGLERVRVRQYEGAAVLAGDFKDEKGATKARDKIREIHPKCITWDKNARGQSLAGVLSTAFIVPNPLAPKPAVTNKPDPLLLKINSGHYSIYGCPGEFTLKVVEFRGAAAVSEPQQKKLEENSMLAVAGEYAENVAHQLRRQNIEAYTYHGLYSSSVCVGAFATPQDPRIEQLGKQLAGIKVAGHTLSAIPTLVPVPKK